MRPIEELFQEVPERGVMVRDEADGFHARISPSPPIEWGRLAVALLAWGAICAGVAWATSDAAELRTATFGGGMAFGMLLYVFRLASGFLPRELAASNGVLYLQGDRRPLDQVGGARLHGHRLEVYGVDDTVVGEIHGVPDDVGRWLVAAIAVMVEDS